MEEPIKVNCPHCKGFNLYNPDYDEDHSYHDEDHTNLIQCLDCEAYFVINYIWQPVLKNVYALEKIDPSQGLLEVAQ